MTLLLEEFNPPGNAKEGEQAKEGSKDLGTLISCGLREQVDA
jgi:hypothetical protein